MSHPVETNLVPYWWGLAARRGGEYVRGLITRPLPAAPMNPTLQALLALQAVDRDIFKVEAELERLPREIGAREEALASHRAMIEERKRQVHEQRTGVKEIEHVTSGRRQHLRKLEQSYSSGKADAALMASYEHEMRNTKRTINDAESDALEKMEMIETLERDVQELEASYARESAVFAEFEASARAEIAAAKARLADLTSKRALVSSDGIPTDQLEKYRGLLRTRGGEALAELSGGICQGCFVNLPRNLVVRLARGNELVTCPSCDRILYAYA